jgi:hypothetical protein
VTHVLVSLAVFIVVFASAMVGLRLRYILPEHHFNSSSADAIKLATGLIATLAALVLGLLVSSAKHSLDTVNAELQEYGPPAQTLRQNMNQDYARALALLNADRPAQVDQLTRQDRLQRLQDYQVQLMALPAADDVQRQIRTLAVQLQGQISVTRWLVLLQREGSLSTPLLFVLVLWLVVIFAAFGLLSPPNGAVVAGLLLCALSAAGAIFLILEMDRPLDGVIHISIGPLRDAIARLGH